MTWLRRSEGSGRRAVTATRAGPRTGFVLPGHEVQPYVEGVTQLVVTFKP